MNVAGNCRKEIALLLETVASISVIVIAAFIVIAVIALIPLVLRILRIARVTEKILESVRTEVPPVAHHVTVISQEVNGILQSVHRNMERVEETIIVARDAAERLRRFEETGLNIVEAPVIKLTRMVRAVSRGVGAFVRFLQSPSAR